jgi:hypothetical protein
MVAEPMKGRMSGRLCIRAEGTPSGFSNNFIHLLSLRSLLQGAGTLFLEQRELKIDGRSLRLGMHMLTDFFGMTSFIRHLDSGANVRES